MLPKISACMFIKDGIEGAFCPWESMATLIPLVDEYVVFDCGSTDGTLENLKSLATRNRKIRVEQGDFPINPITGQRDAGSFAEVANKAIDLCKNDLVLYHQADEIWHENLVAMMAKKLEAGIHPKGMAFWRYQLRENFQTVKWFPHAVHRVGFRDSFSFVGDGMNTSNYNDPPICSNFDGGWFIKWGDVFKDYPTLLPTHEMILDVSSIGGFIENIKLKREKHAPFWNENPNEINLGGYFVNLAQWYQEQQQNMNWFQRKTPFQIPEIMKGLVGETRYPMREEILLRIARG